MNTTHKTSEWCAENACKLVQCHHNASKASLSHTSTHFFWNWLESIYTGSVRFYKSDNDGIWSGSTITANAYPRLPRLEWGQGEENILRLFNLYFPLPSQVKHISWIKTRTAVYTTEALTVFSLWQQCWPGSKPSMRSSFGIYKWCSTSFLCCSLSWWDIGQN